MASTIMCRNHVSSDDQSRSEKRLAPLCVARTLACSRLCMQAAQCNELCPDWPYAHVSGDRTAGVKCELV